MHQVLCHLLLAGETFNGFTEADYTLSVLDIGSGGTHADGDIVVLAVRFLELVRTK